MEELNTSSVATAEKEEIRGLTSAEACAEAARGNANISTEKVGKSYARICFENLFTFFNFVWTIVAVVLVSIGSFNNLTFLCVIIPNVLIAIVQEIRAKRTVEKLSVTTEPKATVMRDGEFIEIDAKDVVLGDVMKIELGRQVLSDSVVLSGFAEANESMLTGESNAIKKQAGDTVLAGSFLVSGSIIVKVVRVGANNYVHKIEHAAKGHKKPVSNLFRDLNRLIKYIGIFLVPMTCFMLISNLSAYKDEGLITAIEKTCGSVIGMIPAGVYLLVTVTLTLSVISLSKKKTLVQDMYSIEMLAAADVVCLDKTGTITDGTMQVTLFETIGGESADEAFKIMKYIEGAESSINNTSKALIEYFGTEECNIIDKIPFSSARKFSAVEIEGVGCYAIGAPGFVPCEVSAELDAKIKSHAKLGERVILLARLDSLSGRGNAIAVVALSDRIRPNAAETIANFQDAGVSVRIISGDHAETVATIAARVGVKNADKFLSCNGIDDEELVRVCDDYAVFGRVTPEQKVLLIKTFKERGHTVAMTGDGVNDTLALKEANCAIAMADGSEVARKVAQIVLLDSDFARLPDVVKEGRRCINNVRQSAVLFLMKTVFTILLSIFTAATVTGYPFEPSQFILLELFVIGISSVLLAIEPNNNRIVGTFLRRVLIKSVPNALVMFLPILILLLTPPELFGVNTVTRNAVATIAVTLVGLINLLALCRPFNKWRMYVCLIIVGGITLAVGVNFILKDAVLGLLPAFENLLFFLGIIGIAISLSLIMHMFVKYIEKFVDTVVTAVESKLKKTH